MARSLRFGVRDEGAGGLADEGAGDHPADAERVHDLGADAADARRADRGRSASRARRSAARCRRRCRGSACRCAMCSSPKACSTGMPEECALQSVPGRPARAISGLGDRGGDRRVGAREIVPVPGHRHAGQLPVAGGRVLAAGDLGGGAPEPGGGLGEARQVDAEEAARIAAPRPSAARFGTRSGPERPASAWPAAQACDDVAERVGALVAEGGGVRGAAAADGVHDEEDARGASQAIRSMTSGRSSGGASAMV